MFTLQRSEGINAHISQEQAALIGIGHAFTVQLFCRHSLAADYKLEAGLNTYMLSSEVADGFGLEVNADLSNVDQKIIDAIGVCVSDIHDFEENQHEEDAEYYYHFDRTNTMFIDLETGQAYNSDMTAACGWG